MSNVFSLFNCQLLISASIISQQLLSAAIGNVRSYAERILLQDRFGKNHPMFQQFNMNPMQVIQVQALPLCCLDRTKFPVETKNQAYLTRNNFLIFIIFPIFFYRPKHKNAFRRTILFNSNVAIRIILKFIHMQSNHQSVFSLFNLIKKKRRKTQQTKNEFYFMVEIAICRFACVIFATRIRTQIWHHRMAVHHFALADFALLKVHRFDHG